jgi:hypothetical protein
MDNPTIGQVQVFRLAVGIAIAVAGGWWFGSAQTGLLAAILVMVALGNE